VENQRLWTAWIWLAVKEDEEDIQQKGDRKSRIQITTVLTSVLIALNLKCQKHGWLHLVFPVLVKF
jgi:hypothetical protein